MKYLLTPFQNRGKSFDFLKIIFCADLYWIGGMKPFALEAQIDCECSLGSLEASTSHDMEQTKSNHILAKTQYSATKSIREHPITKE